MKIGDKLLCKVDTVVAAGSTLPKNYYTKNKYYKIVKFLGNSDEIMVVENNLKEIVQNPQNIFFKDDIERNFSTTKELRKQKLDEINNK